VAEAPSLTRCFFGISPLREVSAKKIQQTGYFNPSFNKDTSDEYDSSYPIDNNNLE